MLESALYGMELSLVLSDIEGRVGSVASRHKTTVETASLYP